MIHYHSKLSQPRFFGIKQAARPSTLVSLVALLLSPFSISRQLQTVRPKEENPPQLEIIYNHLSSREEGDKTNLQLRQKKQTVNWLFSPIFMSFASTCFAFFCKRRKLLEIKNCIRISDKTNKRKKLIYFSQFFQQLFTSLSPFEVLPHLGRTAMQETSFWLLEFCWHLSEKSHAQRHCSNDPKKREQFKDLSCLKISRR